jgi:hypothetical protein
MFRAINELLLWRHVVENHHHEVRLIENHKVVVSWTGVFIVPQEPARNQGTVLTKMKNIAIHLYSHLCYQKMSFSRTAEKQRKRPHGNPDSRRDHMYKCFYALTQVCPFLVSIITSSLYLSTSPNTCERIEVSKMLSNR